GGFDIEFENFVGPLVTINGVSLMTKNHDLKHFPLNLIVKKGEKYILSGPNGIGKSTLLKRLLNAHDKDATIHDGVRIGYYSQDFNALDMNMSVWDALHEVSDEITDQEVYRTASHFLLTSDLLKNSIGSLSEGQKGLLRYARFVIQKPHLLILDEPTNHINFRHLPVIAEALKEYEGAIIMVSHDQTFVDQLGYLETVDLGRLIKDSQG
ncbi:MAG TPA: ATP-binding cassette domain-containing protein, partial [Candidatus Absconditabacterales bacterium]|nr:ATP-binding cassette domain-containing protein [Candidatus Absconditabacterales bacterium]